MKFVQKDNDGNIIAASNVQYDGFEESIEEYDVGFDGKIYSASEMQGADYTARKAAYEEELEKNLIRGQRAEECFPIINRGELWYNKLTTEQRNELSAWYEAWLDAPQTDIIPDLPSWVK